MSAGLEGVARSDQAGLIRKHDQLSAVSYLQLHHRPVQVGLHGERREEDTGRNLVIGQPVSRERGHFALPLGQGIERVGVECNRTGV